MTNTNKNPDWVKLPATLDSPGYKKASDEFLFTFATAKKHLNPYIQNMQAKLGTSGVLFYVPATEAQVEALLRENHSGLSGLTDGIAPQELVDSCLVSVNTMATVLGVEPRTVQLDEAKGLLVKTRHGQYDTLASCGTLRKALRASESGESDEFIKARTKVEHYKALERERKHLVATGQYVEWEAYQRAREQKDADIKQRILALFEKVLPQKLNGMTATAMLPVLKNEARKLLTELAATERPVGDNPGRGQNVPAAAGSHGQPVGGRKKKARK